MSNQLQPTPRILFFGMPGRFSSSVLLRLLEEGIAICAIVLATRPLPGREAPALRPFLPPSALSRRLPLLRTQAAPSLTTLAREHNLPIWEVMRLAAPETQAQLASYQPDLLCVACFPRRIPRSLLTLPALGALNVHPSLLPAYRGPDPLFWILHAGERQTGVTIHLVDEGLDTGAIVVQERLELAEGLRYSELERLCAELGGRMLVRAIEGLWRGTAKPVPQEALLGSYQPLPGPQDYRVEARAWEARRLYGFVRGIASRERPVEVICEGQHFLAVDGSSYSLGKRETDAVRPDNQGRHWVMCQDGAVCLLLGNAR